MKKIFLKLRIFGIIAALLLSGSMTACKEENKNEANDDEEVSDMSDMNEAPIDAKWEIPDREPTMTDYWNGVAYLENFYSEPGWVGHRGTEIVPVNGVWYRFERFVDADFYIEGKGYGGGTQVYKSTDKGLTWSEPVHIINPGGDDDWSMFGSDHGVYYDGKRWHILFQSISVDPGAKWNISYLVCDEEDATAGEWYAPPGVNNPVIHNGDIWNTIASGDNTATRISGGQQRIYDEGTPSILVEDDGTIYITFHGASNTRGTIFGYRGIASTKDFITYTKAADDCIFSRLDAEGWDVDWHSNGSVGGGAAAYIKDGEYWYMLIESPDRSLACVEDQNWPFGLLRSKTLTNTEWDNWISNPPPELRPVGPMAEPIAAWTYPTLFEDDGITYLAITQSYPVHAYRQYRIAWKEGAEPLEKNTAERRKPATAAPPEKTGTAYEADMNSADGWKAMGKVPAGTESIFVVEGGRYRLAEDEISRAVEIDLSRNPVFSITIDEMDPPRLFVRLQVPGLAAQPGYDVGYIGFEALGFEGVSTFNINDELNWLGYFDEDASEIKNCVLNIWAHQCEAVISDIRIEYYEQG